MQVVGADLHDLHDPVQVSAALTGADAVVSTVGVNPSRRAVTTYSVGTGNILAAMPTAGVRGIACVSSKELDEFGVSDEPLLYRFVFPHLLALVNRTIYADMRRMEQLLRDSDVDWAVLRPAGLFAADHLTPTGSSQATSRECPPPSST